MLSFINERKVCTISLRAGSAGTTVISAMEDQIAKEALEINSMPPRVY